MTEKQKILYESASDLWYTLHENSEKDSSRKYLIEFLKIESQLLQSFDIEQLESKGHYKDTPISHDGMTGRNVAFSILSVLSLNSHWINETDESTLHEILWLVALVLTHPLATNEWTRLLKLIDKL